MSVSSLKFRHNVHQRSAQAAPSSPVFRQHIYKGIMSYQKLLNLALPELMRNPGCLLLGIPVLDKRDLQLKSPPCGQE